VTLPWFNESEHILFGRDISAEINTLLQHAAHASSFDEKRAEQRLWRVQQMHPRQLVVYIVIYKFYLFRGRLAEAHQTLRQAMVMAAEEGGFAADWTALHADATAWHSPDGPQRVYLYCLKALSVILQRMGGVDESYRIVKKLYEIDPGDQTGASVMRMLARDVMQEEK
jgi:hypothetical protein